MSIDSGLSDDKNGSQTAERSKALLEGTMSEQLIFLSRATLEINDFSADLSYSEHERALCKVSYLLQVDLTLS